MSRVWTVRCKTHICSKIPQGFTIQVTTQQNVHDYSALRNAILAKGLPHIGGHEHDGSWDWF